MNTAPALPMSRARLKRVLSFGNGIALGTGLWAFLWPRPYPLVLALCFVLPLLAIGLDVYERGVLTFEARRGRALQFSMATMTLMPSLGLAGLAILYFNIVDVWRLIVISVGAALLIVALFWRYDAQLKENKNQLLTVAFFALAYSWGVLATANVLLDSSERIGAHTQIRAMRVHVSGGVKGSSVWHQVKVDKDATPAGDDWINLRPDIYYLFSNGQEVCVHEGRGLLGARWFTIRPCG